MLKFLGVGREADNHWAHYSAKLWRHKSPRSLLWNCNQDFGKILTNERPHFPNTIRRWVREWREERLPLVKSHLVDLVQLTRLIMLLLLTTGHDNGVEALRTRLIILLLLTTGHDNGVEALRTSGGRVRCTLHRDLTFASKKNMLYDKSVIMTERCSYSSLSSATRTSSWQSRHDVQRCN
jgi:hypothetical protein